ncbi:MAG: Hsp20/alpha crystallin family protein [Armatimonadota bacterium]
MNETIPVNIYEEENRTMVATPVPGMEPANIGIDVDGRQLVINCGLRGPGQDRTKEYFLREWRVGPYRRIVTLPRLVDVSRANATYDNGVLVIILPVHDMPTVGTLVLDKVGTAKGLVIGHVGRDLVPPHLR